jgi:hypothetical protein
VGWEPGRSQPGPTKQRADTSGSLLRRRGSSASAETAAVDCCGLRFNSWVVSRREWQRCGSHGAVAGLHSPVSAFVSTGALALALV